MNPLDELILESHRHYYTRYMKCGTVSNLWPHVLEELLGVMHRNYDPYYFYNKNCPACKLEFLTSIYQLYDKQRTIPG